MNYRTSIAIAFVLLLSAPVFGQSSRQSESAKQQAAIDDVVRISVTLVQVDAVVTDRRGRIITDLKPEEFELYQDGKKQRITHFSFIAAEPAVATPVAERPSVAAPPVPPVNLRPERVRRTIALVVDDLTLSFESTVVVREALRKFVDREMQSGDLVAIIRAGAGVGALQQFTTDKRILYAAIDRVRFNMTGRARIGAFAPISGQRTSLQDDQDDRVAFEDLERFREELFSVGTLGAVNYVVRGLRDLPGRKSVILMSEGFRIFDRDRDNSRIRESLRRLTDLANRASVVVYTIDPRGLQPLGLTAADDVSGLTRQQVESQFESRRNEFFDSQEGLSYLAHETGGLFVRNTNNIHGGIVRALEDQNGYYLLAYEPDQSTFRREGGRAKFHKLHVAVTRPGLRVRYRNGFYGVPDAEARPSPSTPGQRLAAAITSPFASGDLRLKLTSLFGNDAAAGSFVRSMLHIDTSGLTFTREEDGTHKTVFDIVAITFGDNGIVVDQISRSYTLRAPDEGYKRILLEGLIYTINLPIKKAGAYQLRTAVLDAETNRVGSASQFIDVPDLKKNRLAVSGLVVGSRDSVVTASTTEGKVETENPMANPAVRVFRPGSIVSFGLVIYNARLERGAGKPQLEVQVKLFREGSEIYSGPSRPLTVDHQDLKRIPATSTLQLGTGVEPGAYVLQVVVTDKLAKEKHRTVSQWIDFEVAK